MVDNIKSMLENKKSGDERSEADRYAFPQYNLPEEITNHPLYAYWRKSYFPGVVMRSAVILAESAEKFHFTPQECVDHLLKILGQTMSAVMTVDPNIRPYPKETEFKEEYPVTEGIESTFNALKDSNPMVYQAAMNVLAKEPEMFDDSLTILIERLEDEYGEYNLEKTLDVTVNTLFAHMYLMIGKVKGKKTDLTPNQMLLAAYFVAIKVNGDEQYTSVNDIAYIFEARGIDGVTAEEIRIWEKAFLVAIAWDVSYQPSTESFSPVPAKEEVKALEKQVAVEKKSSAAPLPSHLQDPLPENLGMPVINIKTLSSYGEQTRDDMAHAKDIAEDAERLDAFAHACELYLQSIEKDYQQSMLSLRQPGDVAAIAQDDAVKMKYTYFSEIKHIAGNAKTPANERLHQLQQKFNSPNQETVMKALSVERGNPIAIALRNLLSYFTSYFRKSALGEKFVDKLNQYRGPTLEGTNASALATNIKLLVETSPKAKPKPHR